MHTKLMISLHIINMLIFMMIIILCIYQRHQYGITIHKNKTIVQQENTKQYYEEVKEVKENVNKTIDTQDSKLVNLGNFKLTAYCSCHICCGKWANNRPNGIVYGSIGEELKEGYSIAVDPNVIPYNTEVIINGNVYKAQDCGGGIKGNEIDIYFENHQNALEFGVQYAEVFEKR